MTSQTMITTGLRYKPLLLRNAVVVMIVADGLGVKLSQLIFHLGAILLQHPSNQGNHLPTDLSYLMGR